MGILGKGLKAGVAKKAVDEARKPQNKRKIKGFISSLTDSNKGGSKTRT